MMALATDLCLQNWADPSSPACTQAKQETLHFHYAPHSVIILYIVTQSLRHLKYSPLQFSYATIWPRSHGQYIALDRQVGAASDQLPHLPSREC